MSGFGDLIPQFALRWNMGVHNWMTYITGDIPVGSYDSTRLANLGHWPRRDRLGRRLHLLQSGNRARVLGRRRLHLQLRKPRHRLQERRRFPPRHGRLAVPQQTVCHRCRRLCVSAADRRQRLRRTARRLQVARVRHRTAADLHFSARRRPGRPEPQGLQGICRRAPAGRLERVAHTLRFHRPRPRRRR